MTEGPLNESEMAWLEETLMSYGHDDASVIDVSELDGMLTAVLSGPAFALPFMVIPSVLGDSTTPAAPQRRGTSG